MTYEFLSLDVQSGIGTITIERPKMLNALSSDVLLELGSLLREVEKSNKSSLVFSLAHEEGSLSKVLTILSFYDVNLTKIQSLPIIGHEWEYLFYVDVSFDNLTRYRQSIDAITPLVKNIKILGEYETC